MRIARNQTRRPVMTSPWQSGFRPARRSDAPKPAEQPVAPPPAAAATPAAEVKAKAEKKWRKPFFGPPPLHATAKEQPLKFPLVLPKNVAELQSNFLKLNFDGEMHLGGGVRVYRYPSTVADKPSQLGLWFRSRDGEGKVIWSQLLVLPIEIIEEGDGDKKQKRAQVSKVLLLAQANLPQITSGLKSSEAAKHAFGKLLIDALEGKKPEVKEAVKTDSGPAVTTMPKAGKPLVTGALAYQTTFEKPLALPDAVANAKRAVELAATISLYRHPGNPEQLSVWYQAPAEMKGKVKLKPPPPEMLFAASIDAPGAKTRQLKSIESSSDLDSVVSRLATAEIAKHEAFGKPLLAALTAEKTKADAAKKAAEEKAAAEQAAVQKRSALKTKAADKNAAVLDRYDAALELAGIYDAMTPPRTDDAKKYRDHAQAIISKREAALKEKMGVDTHTPKDRTRYAIEYHSILVKLAKADEAKAFLESRIAPTLALLNDEGDKSQAAFEKREEAMRELKYALKQLGGEHEAKLKELEPTFKAIETALKEFRKPKPAAKPTAKDPEDSDAPISMEGLLDDKPKIVAEKGPAITNTGKKEAPKPDGKKPDDKKKK